MLHRDRFLEDAFPWVAMTLTSFENVAGRDTCRWEEYTINRISRFMRSTVHQILFSLQNNTNNALDTTCWYFYRLSFSSLPINLYLLSGSTHCLCAHTTPVIATA
ncbi:hypothetical protein H2248_001703 [Termitomyces sp. 'cryptogamus']|nr:hypothetical protein H2248_001703 [Termitomyces sp. 'cryptogamus']